MDNAAISVTEAPEQTMRSFTEQEHKDGQKASRATKLDVLNIRNTNMIGSQPKKQKEQRSQAVLSYITYSEALKC